MPAGPGTAEGKAMNSERAAGESAGRAGRFAFMVAVAPGVFHLISAGAAVAAVVPGGGPEPEYRNDEYRNILNIEI
jgi:hypothetical protein